MFDSVSVPIVQACLNKRVFFFKNTAISFNKCFNPLNESKHLPTFVIKIITYIGGKNSLNK